MKKKSQIRKNWPKYTLQWGVLAAIIFFVSGLAVKIFKNMTPADPETYCPMGGLEAFITYLTHNSLPCSMSSLQILMGLALAAGVILFSKLFCAFVCPVGTVEDILTNIRKGIGINGIEIRQGSVLDKILRIFKYALLFWIFYTTATASELFCKNLDPYYAVATGFKGEITLWMSIVTVSLVVVFGFFIKRFWCKYICPLGAASNSLKFWIWMVVLVGIYWVLNRLGVKIEWIWLLGAWCLLGYLLEIFHSNPKAQLLHVIVDEDRCGKTCHSCQKACPYNIDAPACGGIITNVDCTLCGECVAACPSKTLSIGVLKNKKERCGFSKFIPVILTIALVLAAFFIGKSFELPTIDISWDTENVETLETVKIQNLTSVKCYGSSMAFKARMEKVKGVHGVKTYVGSHSVVVSYDPKVTTAEKVQSEAFIPSRFRVNRPDYKTTPELKVMTIRTEKMYDKLNLNFLGIQFMYSDKTIYGLESIYDCPLIIKVYMDPGENPDEAWFEKWVDKKTIDIPTASGEIKSTPVDFEFVRLEKGEETISTVDFIEKFFTPFNAEFNGEYPSADSTIIMKRAQYYEGKPQFIYEIPGEGFEKPLISRYFPYLSNHLSREEGIIGMYMHLNKDYVPSLQVRYAAPATAERIWELMSMDTWTITYKKDDVREEPAKFAMPEPGYSYPYVEEVKDEK